MRADGKIAGLSAHPTLCRGTQAEMMGCFDGWRPQWLSRVRRPATASVVLAMVSWAVLFSGAQAAERAPTVILISLDGTRPADITPAATPILTSLTKRGAVAARMTAAIPTNTFPNHVTLVTGVFPERHGLVNNVFVDPERGLFEKKSKDIPSWIEVEPLWSLLSRAGLASASYYWVGSEGNWKSGYGPSETRRFSGRTPESKKVDQILRWIDRPPARQPRLITSWFHGADRVAHRKGPGSPEVAIVLAEQDAEIGRLIDGLEARGRLVDTTLLFVSDHGMALAKRRVDLATALEKQDGISARVLGIGGFASIVLSRQDRADPRVVRRIVLRAEQLGLEAVPRAQAPDAWRVDNPRFGDLVVRAPVGTAIVYSGLEIEGFHGYAPEAKEMAAIFMAIGRGARPGTRLKGVRSVDVAPTVLALLGQPVPDWMEGRPIAGIVPGATPSATLVPPGASAPPPIAEDSR